MFVVSLAMGFVGPTIVFAATAPSIGSASTYAIVSNTFTKK
jgi:hypothetical protein